MNTFASILSSAQITALKNVATAPVVSAKFTNLSEKTWEVVYDLATEIGVSLAPRFWSELDSELKNDVIVYMKCGENAQIMPVEKRFAKHYGEMLKRGYSLVLAKRKNATVISWKNWKEFYASLTQKPSRQEYDPHVSRLEERAIVTERKRQKAFSEAAATIGSRKSMRMRSFEDARIQRVRAERATFEARVEVFAAEIFAAI